MQQTVKADISGQKNSGGLTFNLHSFFRLFTDPLVYLKFKEKGSQITLAKSVYPKIIFLIS